MNHRAFGHGKRVIEPLPVCLEGPLGRTIGARVMELHTAHGVRLHNGVSVSRLLGNQDQGVGGQIAGIELSNGALIQADVALVAIGAQPTVDWLQGSGLTLKNGIVCDEYGEAAPGIYAVGDVANWYHPTMGRSLRLEHRMNANEQALAVARTIIGQRTPFAPVPFFWTDQFEVKIQVYGVLPYGANIQIIEEDFHQNRFVATYSEGENLAAVLGWNSLGQIMTYRKQLVDRLSSLR